MARTDLASRVVRPYFKHRRDADEVRALERTLHDNDAPTPWARFPPEGRPENWRYREPVGDVLFGAFVLLAIVLEVEDWTLVDDSEDQIALLTLGPLQPLEPVLVARRIPEVAADFVVSLRRSPLRPEDRAFLDRWAKHRVDLVRRQSQVTE
jgi:hypothetical protein